MSDRYSQLVNAPVGSTVAKQVGLPQPVDLDRYQPGAPVVAGPVLSGAAPGGRLERPLKALLDEIGAERAGAEGKAKALVFDATGIADSTELVELQRFFYPAVAAAAAQRPRRRPRHAARRRPARPAPTPPSGRWRASPARSARRSAAAARPRSSSTSSPGAEDQLDSTLRFLLSPRSAYVSGQVVRIGKGVAADAGDRLGAPARRQGRRWSPAPRAGSARRSPRRSRRDGAKVVGLDVPQAAADLRAGRRARSAARRSPLDITAADAPRADRRALRRRRRRRRPQRRRHPRPHDREDAGGPLERS